MLSRCCYRRGVPMTPQNVAFIVVAIIVLGFIASWIGYLRTWPPQTPADIQSEEPARPCPAGS